MPIYEYQCTHCHHHFEEIQKMSDAPITTCPECKKETAQRLVSAAGFQLKGSGWYVTDFRDKGKPAEKKASATTEQSSTTTEKSTETTTSTQSKGEST